MLDYLLFKDDHQSIKLTGTFFSIHYLGLSSSNYSQQQLFKTCAII